MVKLEKNDWVDVASSLLLVAASLLLAWWLAWSATDLIWSVWVSSLLTGWLIIVPSFFTFFRAYNSPQESKKASPKRKKSTSTPAAEQSVPLTLKQRYPIAYYAIRAVGVLAAVAFTLFTTLFLLFHFTAFHIVHAVFLNHLFPLFDMEQLPFPPNGQEFMQYYFPLVWEYLLFLPLALWTVRRKLLSRNTSPVAPYVGVVRMHLFIIFFGMLFLGANLRGFTAYVLVYGVFFFPWSVVGRLRKKRKGEAEARGEFDRKEKSHAI